METKGRRVYPQEDGHLHLSEGDYGYDPIVGHWVVRPPGHNAGGIPHHGVIEHEDGTITVTPSIVLEDYESNQRDSLRVAWHGFLEHGIWREA